MAETIQSVMKDPVGFVEEITDLEKYAKLAGQWDNLHKIFADSLEQQMRVQNPYWDLENDTFVDGQRARYEQFRGGYYVGMLLFEVALEATGAGAADKLADFKKVQQFASKPRIAKALRYTQKASKYTPSAVVMRNGGKVARLVARRSGIDADFASSVVARGKTVGKQWRVAQAAKRLDGTKFADLSDAGKENLVAFLSRSDDDGVRFISKLDAETARRFFELGCGSGTASAVGLGTTATRATTGESCDVDWDRFRQSLKQSVVENGNVNGVDAGKVINKIYSRSGEKQQRAALLVQNARGEGGAEFLADADESTIDDVLTFEVGSARTDLQEKVRVGLVQSYSRNYFSLSAQNSWVKEVYPNVEGPSDVVGEIAQDIDTLNSGDDINGEVRGLARTLSRGNDGGSGAYLENIPDPDASDNGNFDPSSPVKGAALELRTARQAAEDLDAGETIRMSADPDVDFDQDLSERQIKDVAEKVYGSRDRSLVGDDLGLDRGGKDPEFDAVQVVSNEDSGQTLVYLESKNTVDVPGEQKIRKQAARFFATQISRGADVEDLKMTVVTRTEAQAKTLNNQIDAKWFSARAGSAGSE